MLKLLKIEFKSGTRKRSPPEDSFTASAAVCVWMEEGNHPLQARCPVKLPRNFGMDIFAASDHWAIRSLPI